MNSQFCCAIVASALVVAVAGELCNPVTETRLVEPFARLHANDGIKVNVMVSPSAGVSLRVSANADFMPKVGSKVVDGTLILSLAEGAASSCVTVEIVVPQPLQSASTFGRADMSVDSVAGRVAASMGGKLNVGTLFTLEPVSVIADARGEIRIANGTVGSLTVACSSESNIDLGTLKARQATVLASHRSSVSNLTVDTAFVEASVKSSVHLSATRSLGILCFGSDIKVRGSAELVTYASNMCKVEQSDIELAGVILP